MKRKKKRLPRNLIAQIVSNKCICKDKNGEPKMLYRSLSEANAIILSQSQYHTVKLKAYPCPSEVEIFHLTKSIL